ncbi:MAG: LamG-like jellyroll fold domain-containing protein, partial [Pseudomonadota bacterium]
MGQIKKVLSLWVFVICLGLGVVVHAHEDDFDINEFSSLSLKAVDGSFQWELSGTFDLTLGTYGKSRGKVQYSLVVPGGKRVVVAFDELPKFNLWRLSKKPVTLVGHWDSEKTRLLDGAGRAFVFKANSIVADDSAYDDDPIIFDHAESDEYWAEKAQDYPAFQRVRSKTDVDDPGQFGQWGPVLSWPHIPVSASNLPDGRVLTFASNRRDAFPGGQPEFTYTAVWDPSNGSFLEIDYSGHDMFCGHLVMLEDGTVFVNGGRKTVVLTSKFDYLTNTWTAIEDMVYPRWYPTTVRLPDDSVFTAIGSSSTPGQRTPEIWRQGQGWQALNGINFQDPVLNYSSFERHWWPFLHVDSDGLIFHAGPTPKMHRIDVNANGIGGNPGQLTEVGDGLLGGTWYPKHGTNVLYDEDKLLIAGGATSGSNGASTNLAAVIDISNASAPQVTSVAPMNFARRFSSGIILPNGEVLVVGGNTSGIKFSDDGTVLAAEIWNPTTQTWKEVADMDIPRNYHSIALLLNDGRVLSGGGGLCGGCAANHQDGQVYSPPYLFNADGSLASRPSISFAPATVDNGEVYNVTVSGGPITKFSLLRLGATTHGVNSDQRYISVPFASAGGNDYNITMHANPNVLMGGHYQLFALNAQGVPSEAAIIQVVPGSGPNNLPPVLTNPGDQISFINAQVILAIDATDPNDDDITYSATGLPSGYTIDSDTGVISGVAATPGAYSVSVTADDSRGGIDDVSFDWDVLTPAPIPNLADVWGFAGNADSSSGTNNGTFFNGASTVFDADRSSDVLSCDGTNDYVQINNNISASFTFTAWVRTSASSSTGTNAWEGDGLIWSDVSGTANDFMLSVLNNRLSFLDGDTGQTTTGNTVLNDGVWHHVAVTRQAGGNVSLYVDGALDATGSAGTALLTANPNIAFCGNLVDNRYYDGLMDDVRQYDRALTVTEIIQLASVGADPLVVSPITSSPQQVNSSIEYTAQVTGGSSPEYLWLFGDGTPETSPQSSPTISHTFTQAGRYNVRLTVRDSTGQEEVINFWQAIHEPILSGSASSSSSIIYDSASDRIWNVNPDNDSVSVFNALNNTKVTEITVGEAPRSLAQAPDGRIWVTNKRSDTISVISTATLNVQQTITLDTGSLPFGIVFNSSDAFVALEGTGELIRLNGTAGTQNGSLSLGSDVRHVSIAADGTTALVS